ncbi:MAG: CD1247 N-terminal domain-containing protein [Sarcina sp.]
MDNIRENLVSLKVILDNNKDLDNEFNRKLLEVVNGLFDNIEGITVNLETVTEDVALINDDLSNVQEELFEEMSFEELEEAEDEYVEVKCQSCSKPIYVENSVLKNKEKISCPYCTNQIN